jgi:hypothetical protein
MSRGAGVHVGKLTTWGLGDLGTKGLGREAISTEEASTKRETSLTSP